MSTKKKKKKLSDEIASTVLLDLMHAAGGKEEKENASLSRAGATGTEALGNLVLGIESGAPEDDKKASALNMPEPEPTRVAPAGMQDNTRLLSDYMDEKTKKFQPEAHVVEKEADNHTRVQDSGGEDKTVALYKEKVSEHTKPNATSLVQPRKQQAVPEVKVSVGAAKAQPKNHIELQLFQSENLRMAQERISELERELDKARQENEILLSASELTKAKVEELSARISALDKEKLDLMEQNEVELRIFRDAMEEKDREVVRLQAKIQELEHRLSSDLKKIRVRERELENRLELSKSEKSTLLKGKDEFILELKRRTDQLNLEIDTYKNRIAELNRKIDSNQEQFGRTVRALRLALTNLEVSDTPVVPLKKAE